MVNLTLPIGARDLLPLDVAQKQWIETRLQSVFRSWGYHCIITPTLEHLGTLTVGGAVKLESVIQVDGSNAEVLGLRPELTASIARAYASRLGKVTSPQRLYYNDNVFRKLPSSNRQQEYYQSGVELLGGAGILADAEILLLLAKCLESTSLNNWQMVLGDVGLTTALLNTFPVQYQAKVRRCIAELDRIGLLNLAMPEQLKSQALDLIDLRGQPHEVLERILSLTWVKHLDTEIQYLQSLIALIEHSFPVTPILDLSLVQSFGYYTGIVFEVVSGNYVIAQGGRYDQLLGLYNAQCESHPSIGFCLNLEDLHKVLMPTLPREIEPSAWLVVAIAPDAVNNAFSYASDLRTKYGVAVELELEFRDRDAVVAYGRSRGIKQVAWVSSSGVLSTENL
ncbi:ATP phosphoribosyltransferase involved in histidine biosynthesis [Synechococcus sp. PCC 7502]|uniref:ATP phosphoribosyltransferase regulatory subunit n=1 Tax=Synechococcus sp. PCC 7502 TaxID=1173263 RepID=UPI00029F84CD|nr:ATP phosphoribosyltransferase regulatory subunit [Synechococcus sp. PCC 7502]AFY75304.1 ATP phosphoribosyltransferase involved in histidine biosynthesis [Synechococcus sp. PCC 7502]